MKSEDVLKPMSWRWAVGQWEGDQAQPVIDLANSGTAYFNLGQGRKGNTKYILAAFRRPTTSPLPDHLSFATDQMVRKLDKMFNERHSYGGF